MMVGVSAAGMTPVGTMAVTFAFTIFHIPFQHFQLILMASFQLVIHMPKPSAITGHLMHRRHARHRRHMMVMIRHGHRHWTVRHLWRLRQWLWVRHGLRLRHGHGFSWFFHNEIHFLLFMMTVYPMNDQG